MYGFCQILPYHFHKRVCKKAPYSVGKVLVKLDGNGRTAHDAGDASMASKGKQREKEWMLKLQKVFSYSLNGCLGDDFLKEDTHVLVRSKFPALPRKSTTIFRIYAHKLYTSFSSGTF